MRVLNATLSIIIATSAAVAQTAPTDSMVAPQLPPIQTGATNAKSLVMSLDECLQIALSDNPTIKVADMEITRYDYSRKEVLGQLLPSINFGASYNRMIAKQVTYMNMDAFKGFGAAAGAGAADGSAADAEGEAPASRAGSKGNDTGIKMGLDNSYQVGFNASLPIIAPQLWKTLKLNDAQILQSVEEARQSRIKMINQVKNAYYGLMLAMDSREVILESYDMAKFTADIYKKKHAVGAASDYDVLRTEVAVKNIEPDVLQSEIAVRQAMLQLAILMGMEPGVEITPSDKLRNHESTMYETALNIDRNISNNSDLRMLEIQTEQLNRALDIKKMAWYPTLALTASYNWTSSSNGSPFKNFRWNPFSVVGLSFNLPLFTGGQRYYSIKGQQVQLDEMAWQRDNLTKAIKMQVELAVDNINKNIQQISSSSETVMQAEKAHDIMARSFEIGAASYLDLRDSELALTRSRLSYYQSLYNYLVAHAELELLLGNADVSKYMPAY